MGRGSSVSEWCGYLHQGLEEPATRHAGDSAGAPLDPPLTLSTETRVREVVIILDQLPAAPTAPHIFSCCPVEALFVPYP